MNEQEIEELFQALNTMAIQFGVKDWGDKRAITYIEAPEIYPVENSILAMKKLRQTSNFFPTVNQIIEAGLSQYTFDDIYEHLQLLGSKPSMRTDGSKLSLICISIIKELGGWEVWGRSPDPKISSPDRVKAFKEKLQHAIAKVQTQHQHLLAKQIETTRQQITSGETI